MYTLTHVYMFMFSTYVHIYTLVYILMCLSVYVCPYLFVCSCVHIYTLVYILMCIHTHDVICYLFDMFICYLFIWSKVHKLICSYVPAYTTTYGHTWSLVTRSHIHLITQWSPVLLHTHVLLKCSRVHLFIVPCAHMACTHDIACPHTHTPMYTHWFTLSHNHRYTCAHIRYVCMLERFHMFPPSVPNWKGG